MKPAPFGYVRAHVAEEALNALHELGEDARILAGGQSLMAMLAMRIVQPTWLIDISRAADLDSIRTTERHLCIGAATTQAQVQWRNTLAQEVPLLAQVLPWIAHYQIRNRATVCGSLAHADPSAELALVLVLLEGEVVLRSKDSQRIVSAENFFQGTLQTARAPDELLQEARFPLCRPGQGFGFAEFAQRRGDFALVSAAARVSDEGIRLVIGAVEDRPRAMQWDRMGESQLESCLQEFCASLDARDDLHASARYRRQLARVLARRVISSAENSRANRAD